MAQTKESVLALLKEQGVPFEVFEHEPVMTCEAQVCQTEIEAFNRAAANGGRAHACEPAACSSLPRPSPTIDVQAAALSHVNAKVTKNLFLRVRRVLSVWQTSSPVWCWCHAAHGSEIASRAVVVPITKTGLSNAVPATSSHSPQAEGASKESLMGAAVDRAAAVDSAAHSIRRQLDQHLERHQPLLA